MCAGSSALRRELYEGKSVDSDPDGRVLPPFDDLIESGKIIGLDFPVALNPALAKTIGTMMKISSAADLAHDKILEGLRAWGYQPERTLDVISLAQAFDFVASGEGIAFVRASSRRFESRRIVLRPLPGLPMLDVGVTYRRDIRSPLVRNLLRIVHEVFAEERAEMMQNSQKS